MSGSDHGILPRSIDRRLGGEVDRLIAAGRVELVNRRVLPNEPLGVLRRYDVYLDYQWVGSVQRQVGAKTMRLRWAYAQALDDETLSTVGGYHTRYGAVWSLLMRRLY